MSDRRDTTDTTVTQTASGGERIHERPPVGGDASASFTPPAESGAELRDDQTHPRGTSAVGPDAEAQMASRDGSLDRPHTGDTGGAAGISMGILWTAVILLVVAAAVILFFAL